MFYCIGETQFTTWRTGIGENIQEAVCNWANEKDPEMALDMWENYSPHSNRRQRGYGTDPKDYRIHSHLILSSKKPRSLRGFSLPQI
jgi:hypothetical protein